MCKKILCAIFLALVLGLVGSASAELVGHWKLDEGGGATAFDSSGGGNDGAIQGDPTWVAGAIGGAIECDGDDWVDCGNVLDLTGGLTIMCWVNPTDFTGDHGFVARDAAYAIKSSGTHLRFTTPGVLDYDGNATILENGVWQHVAASFVPNQSEGLIFYLNGVESERLTTTALNAGTGPFSIANNQWSQFLLGAIDEVRVYDHILTPEEIAEAMLGGGPELATDPSPETEAIDVPRDVVLGWVPGEFAAAHDVYLGTVFDDVNNASRANPLGVLVSEGQADASYDQESVLAFGQTYFWRIDEVNGAPDNTIFKGEVWSFTAEPLAYPIEGVVATSTGISEAGVGPENTVNGSGLNENDEHSTMSDTMWLALPGADPLSLQYEFDAVYKLHEMLVWNYNVQFEPVLGFGLKDVTVEYSIDGTEWAVLGDVQLAQATAQASYTANTTIDMGGVAAKFVRLLVNSGYGPMGQFGLSEVRFMSIPVQAREPQPADGADGVDVNAVLGWRAGREAVTHDVYLGAGGEALALAETIGVSEYAPADLEFGTAYEWRIDEVNEAEAISVWEGAVWSFSTLEYATIDDFESYDDEENRIYDAWLDGYANDTGSTVGYFDAPFAERTIVNSGAQSMPLEYDNSASPFYSETEFDLGSANWSTNGADTLVVNFRGRGPEFLETADGHILMNSIGTDVWGTADEFRYAYMRLSGDGSIVARVESVVNSWPWAKAGVMIREGLDAGSTHAMTVVTPGNGVAFQNRPVMNQASYGVNQTGLEAPYWVKLTRVGNAFTAERSEDGVTWVSITDDVAASTVEIEMGTDVYIGLMSSSINMNAVGGAEFSNISTTGNVTGAWEIAEVGVEQPEGNEPDALYVAVEDGAGNVAVLTHPDPLAVLEMEWQEWQIPFADLAGVNLGNVSMLYIGVGDRDNPSAGGAGLVYVDDVGYGRPAPEPAFINLLVNGGFEDGVMAPWSTYGDVTAEVVADDPVEGNSCLHVMVGSAGANFWDSGLQHTGHVFEAGKTYTLSAFLKCSEGTLDINFKPELAADPWSGFGDQVFTMTDEWTEFSVTTGILETDVDPAAITFHIGFAAADFWIDGVRFYEGEYVPAN